MESQKEKTVHGIFQSISGGYDRMNDVISLGMHRTWKEALVDAVCTRRPGRVLDVCCGTGDVALALAKRLPAASVTGLDLSENMLAQARRRKDRDLTLVNLDLIRGSAMDLPFPAGSFDCVTISFGLRNLPSFEKAMGELVRVTCPGGAVFCLDSYQPDPPAVRPFYRLYFKHLVTLEGRLLAGSGPAYRWLYDSTASFLSRRAVGELMSAQGLEQVAMKPFLFGAAAIHRGVRPALQEKV